MKKFSLTLAILMALTMFASCGKEATTVEDTHATVEFTEVEETEVEETETEVAIEETEPEVDPDDHYYWFVENVPAVDDVFPDLDWYVSDDQHGECYMAGVEGCDESTYATYMELLNRDMFSRVVYEEKDYIQAATGPKDVDHYCITVLWEDGDFDVWSRFVPAED